MGTTRNLALVLSCGSWQAVHCSRPRGVEPHLARLDQRRRVGQFAARGAQRRVVGERDGVVVGEIGAEQRGAAQRAAGHADRAGAAQHVAQRDRAVVAAQAQQRGAVGLAGGRSCASSWCTACRWLVGRRWFHSCPAGEVLCGAWQKMQISDSLVALRVPGPLADRLCLVVATPGQRCGRRAAMRQRERRSPAPGIAARVAALRRWFTSDLRCSGIPGCGRCRCRPRRSRRLRR